MQIGGCRLGDVIGVSPHSAQKPSVLRSGNGPAERELSHPPRTELFLPKCAFRTLFCPSVFGNYRGIKSTIADPRFRQTVARAFRARGGRACGCKLLMPTGIAWATHPAPKAGLNANDPI